jgi:hypothetical protein
VLRIHTGSDEGYVACPVLGCHEVNASVNFTKMFDNNSFYHLLIQLVTGLNIVAPQISQCSGLFCYALNESL